MLRSNAYFMEVLRTGICLIGYGKMGKMIEDLLHREGRDINGIIQANTPCEERTSLLKKSAVAIEFTSPEAAIENIMHAVECGCAVVCGTTGWYAKQHMVFEHILKHEGALIYASNFSTGVYLFLKEAARMARSMQAMDGYAVSIEETHHLAKKDAPSGTAISLAETVLPFYTELKGWCKDEQNSSNALPIKSIREDQVPGTHHLIFRSKNDELVLTHCAFGREGFATGAIEAADWIVGKSGVFGIEEMLSDIQKRQ